MILIFAVDENWNMAYKGEKLAEISLDLKRFKELTEGQIIIIGRRTWDELVGRDEPLPNRTNILMTRNKDYEEKGFISANSIPNLLETLNEINLDDKKVFLAGGQDLVEQLINRCNKAYITKILKTYDEGDKGMVNLDELDDWEIVKESEVFEEDGIRFKFVDYTRLPKIKL